MKPTADRPRTVLTLLTVAAAWFAAVSGDAQAIEPPAAREAAAPARRPPWTTSKVAGSPEPPSPYTVEPAFPHLRFETPVVLVPEEGTSRLFLGDLRGRIWSFPDDPACKRADLALDVARLHPDLTMYYGLAFHPRYERNRYVYVCYALKNDLPDGSVVSRFEVRRTDPPTIDPASEKVLLTFWSGGHNGACLAFGKDGYLYISTGDGGPASPPDPMMTGQDCSDLLSSILRIDVDGADPGRAYRVPPDNPFVKTAGVRPEIWSYGFRNPWKMSFDRTTGDLWVGDVGWELWEMIYRVERGGNYGWSVTEGPQPVHVDGRRGPSPVLPPTIAHPHSEAASITGGYVYRGARIPALQGTYLYGDYQTGTIWGLRHDGKTVTWHQELARTPLHLAAFGENRSGELYLIDHDRTGQIYRLVPNRESGAAATFPRTLSATGLFSSTRDHVLAPGVVPYSVVVRLWADGAEAERFLAVPGDGRITFDQAGNWRCPPGSVLGRTVTVETEAGNAASRRRVETQILHFEADSWRPYTYVWSDDQADAALAPAGGASKSLLVTDAAAPGGRRKLDYRIYARSECILCHNPWVEKKTTIFGRQSASPLALNTSQMNRPCGPDASAAAPGQGLGQLESLVRMGLLESLPAIDRATRLADPSDSSADLDRRARSYLQVHCAHCHQFNAGGAANIALGAEVPLDQTKTVGVKPIQGTFQIDDARIIAPADPARSILYYRISKLGGGRMPRVGTNRVDEQAVRLIHDWIAAMKPAVAGKDAAPAVASLARAEEDRALSTLRQSMGTPSPVRSAALGRLLASTRGALLVVSELGHGPASENLRREAVDSARQSPRIDVRDLFERFIPDSERVQRLGDTVDRQAILSLRGDARRGQEVFAANPAAQCRTCHKLGQSGESVGPDLAKIGVKYDRAALLDHIIEPSRTIDPQYTTQLVATRDGEVVSGLVVERTEKVIVLKDSQARTIRIPRDQVEQVAPQAKSLMPELLLRDLTAQQAADLLEYLINLK